MKIGFSSICAAGALLALVGCKKPQQAGGPPPGFEPKTPVTVAAVEQGTITETAALVGSTRYVQMATLKSEAEGQIVALELREGQRFKRGDVLLRVDERDPQTAVAEVEAALQKATRVLEDLKAPTRPELVAQLAARVTEAEANVTLAADVLARTERLFAQAIQTEAEQVRARAGKATADAFLAQAKAALDEARNGTRPEEIRIAEADVAVQQARLASAKRQLEKCRLLAPWDGVVLSRHVNLGGYVKLGDNVLTVAATGEVEALLAIPERFVRFLQADTTFTLRADALPEETFPARLAAIVPQADERSRNLQVRCTVENPQGLLLGGMFVRAELPVLTKADALLVPPDAVTLRGDQALLFTVADGVVQQHTVRLGLIGKGKVELLEPALAVGTQVVTTGGEVLAPGGKVMVKDPAAAPPSGPPAAHP
jgi:multidrug efflux pump subunit AcrA (membrane-fusion protein)